MTMTNKYVIKLQIETECSEEELTLLFEKIKEFNNDDVDSSQSSKEDEGTNV
jgi:hypothetical protein